MNLSLTKRKANKLNRGEGFELHHSFGFEKFKPNRAVRKSTRFSANHHHGFACNQCAIARTFDMRKTLNPYMESFRRIALTVVVFVLAGSASLNAQGTAVSTSKAKYTAGESITVNFSDGPGNPADWIALYRPDATPGGEWNSIEVTDPPVIRDFYDDGKGSTLYMAEAVFTMKLAPAGNEVAGQVVYADPPDACGDLKNAEALKGNIALVDRGGCIFQDKVQRARDAGALAVIVVNNVAGALVTMQAAEGVTVDIPAVMISLQDGERLKKHLTGGLHVKIGLVWAHVGGTTTPGEDLTDGSVTLDGLDVGDYKAIFFEGDGYTQLASTTFSVEAAELPDITDITILPLGAVNARKGTGLDGRYWQARAKTINNLRDTGLKIITGSHPTATFRATHLTYQGGNDLTTARKWLTRSRTYVGSNGNMDDGILSFTGYIRIDTPPRGIAPGEVVIRSESDDGSMVWIAGTKVVDNDGRHDAPGPTPDGTYNFHTPGYYPIEIAWFNSDSTNNAGDHGDASLNVLVNGNPFPKSVLYTAANVGAVAIAASSITEAKGDAGLAGAYWHTDQGGLQFGEGPRINSEGYIIRDTPIFQVKPKDDQGLVMLGTEPQGRFISTTMSYTGEDLTPIVSWLGKDGKSFTGIDDDLQDALVQFKGFINIKKAGQHDFQSASDDGVVVWIGNQRVVNNDGGHGAPGPTPDGSAFFPVAGLYPIEVAWFNAGLPYGWSGDASLSLKMDGRTIRNLIWQPYAGSAVPTLSIARNADGTLTVTFDGKLQGAPTVNGPWRDSGVTSPVTIRPTGRTLFGRAVK